MDHAELFNAFREDSKALDIPGFQRQVLQHVIRYTPLQSGLEGVVTFARLNKDNTQAEIDRQVDYFEAKNLGFEWKVYGLDTPIDLREQLLNAGFVADDDEVFMLFDLSRLADVANKNPAPVEIRKVCDKAGVRDVIHVQNQVWQQNLDWVGNQLNTKLQNAPERVSIYCAYFDGQAIATGWTDYPENSQFPELHGGGVLSGWRGKGIYSALYTTRLVEAKNRGYRFMAVDASPMSRPILEKLGFTAVCTTIPLRKSPA